tara:strand:+ start:53 stop:457 length:405 start_codon:yes stop_codon:yes gene_type:complete
MNDNINIYDLTFLNKRMYRCGVKIQDFEKDFINSLIKNAKYCTKGVKIYGNVTDNCNGKILLYLSQKQINIFEKIKIRFKNAYNNRCAYYVYSQIIEDYEINLEQYDKDTLESFKGKKESKGSRSWIEEIISNK